MGSSIRLANSSIDVVYAGINGARGNSADPKENDGSMVNPDFRLSSASNPQVFRYE